MPYLFCVGNLSDVGCIGPVIFFKCICKLPLWVLEKRMPFFSLFSMMDQTWCISQKHDHWKQGLKRNSQDGWWVTITLIDHNCDCCHSSTDVCEDHHILSIVHVLMCVKTITSCPLYMQLRYALPSPRDNSWCSNQDWFISVEVLPWRDTWTFCSQKTWLRLVPTDIFGNFFWFGD